MANVVDSLISSDGLVMASFRGRNGGGADSAKLYYCVGDKYLAIYVRTLSGLPKMKKAGKPLFEEDDGL